MGHEEPLTFPDWFATSRSTFRSRFKVEVQLRSHLRNTRNSARAPSVFRNALSL